MKERVINTPIKAALLTTFLLDLFLIAVSREEFRVCTKPLLLPLLLLVYLSQSYGGNRAERKFQLLFTLGLFFSFIGDVFLLSKEYFLPGLASFLLAHLFYIVTFYGKRKIKIPGVLYFLTGLYLIGFLWFLYPSLGEMKIPVILYAVVICVMFLFAFKTNNRSLVIGALLFLVSDSLLAVGLFYNSNLVLSLLVMITYVAAQYFLMQGMTRSSREVRG